MSCAIQIDEFGFTQEEIAHAMANKRLLSMEIEFGRACNFHCPYCYVAAPTATTPILTPEEIRNAVDQGRELGARRLIMLGGEPMLYPGLTDMVRYIADKEMEIYIFTNGTGITPEIARFFFEHSVKVILKFNSFNPAIQNQLTGREWAFDSIQSAFKNLFDAGYPAKEKQLAGSTVICRQNLEELKEMWCWMRDRGVEPYLEMITPQGRGSEYTALSPSSEENETLFYEIAKLDREKYGREWIPQPPLVGNKCQRNRFTCLVDAYGNVQPCVGISIPAGNLRERSLRDILAESKVFEDLRHYPEHIKGPCAQCEQISECYGCRGAAYQLTGDYLASDPLCWHNKNRREEIIHLPAEVSRFAPQKAPMLLIDSLVSVGDNTAAAEATVRTGTPFINANGSLDNAAYLEMMAQTVATLQGFRQHGVKTAEPTSGMLLGCQNLSIRGHAKAGDTLHIEIRKTASFGAFTLFTSHISNRGKIIASGELKVWKSTTSNQPPPSA